MTLTEVALNEVVDRAIKLQSALDWCMTYYPFSENTKPPPEIEDEIRSSRQRNSDKLKGGFRR